MKIGVFTCEYAPYPGGIATYTREMARALVALGHEPVVHTFVDQGAPPADGFEVVQLPPHAYSHMKQPQVMANLKRALARRQFDLAFAADLQTLVALASVGTRVRRRAAVHGTDTQSKLLTAIFRPPFARPLDQFEYVFANSEFTRSLLLSTHRYVAPSRVRAAPLGVSDYWRTCAEDADHAALNAASLIDSARRIVVSTGRLERRKGLHDAIDAVAALPPGLREEVTYIIVGRPMDQAYASLLRSKAAESGADVRIVGTLPVGAIRALYARAQVLLHTATREPRRVEGFGLTVMEAACAGVPAIATRVDALPEVIKHGETGFLAEDGEIAGIRDYLAALLNAPSLRRAMSEACRRHGCGFTWQACARAVFDA